ncbi:TauD/TfdA family dioxygenase [Pseudomonas aeruginosa]|nr:TauD/TfdA family dioxygenase [Pseudomonas aeruginosa]
MDRRRRRRAARQPAAAWRHPVPWLRGGRRGGLLPGRARLFAEHARLPGGAAARQEVAHRVFTSTEFSPDGWIPPHHEMSYSHNWPSYIHFYCQTPPATQGRTPLADERRVSARIPEAIRQRFLRHGVCYVRNYGPEIDLTWQEGFQTDSRAEVEAYCRQTGTQWTWLDDQRLNTRQVRQAMVRHPLSGEPLWFNHAHMFHVSNMPPALAGPCSTGRRTGAAAQRLLR